MIVSDTNLIAHLVMPGERTEEARKVYQIDNEWVAPLLWRSEFRSVLALYLRQGHLQLTQALRLASEAEQIMRGGECDVRHDQVLRLVSTSRCSAHDCEFVALAQALGIHLVTTDRAILRDFPVVAKSPLDFLRSHA